MPNRRPATILIAVFVATLTARDAGAVPIVFAGDDPNVAPGGAHPSSDAAQSAFAAAAGTLETITFEGLTLGITSGVLDPNTTFSMANMQGGAGLSSSGVQQLGFNTTDGGRDFLRVVPAFNVPEATVTFTFATPIDAFGAYITGTEPGVVGTASLTFDDGSAQAIDLVKQSAAGVQFVGFTDFGAAISSVTFHAIGPFPQVAPGNDVWGIDDVQYSIAAVPEPGVLALMSIGLCGVGMCRIRFHRRS
jgi:hypothetical protein